MLAAFAYDDAENKRVLSGHLNLFLKHLSQPQIDPSHAIANVIRFNPLCIDVPEALQLIETSHRKMVAHSEASALTPYPQCNRNHSSALTRPH